MLNAIFEEADLKSKASTSVASGDWQGWTASELDELVKEGEETDTLIGKIVRTGREFPDGLWEAMKRKYGIGELSGSIANYLIDEERGKINLHQSYIDRLVDSDMRRTIQQASRVTRDQKPMRITGEWGNQQHIPWDSSEIEKAKTFIDAVQATKRKKAALKGLETKKVKKENETKEGGEGLKPTQTEHWHRWMPDEVPTEDTPWEKLRPRLKTTSKLDMDIMVRDMEKAGVVTPNEHGNKVFRAAKYQEIMSQPRERFAHSHIKNYNGQYSDMQFIRSHGAADPALISVGMPLALENRWKKEHPKLLKHLKGLRDKKIGGHAPVMKGIRPLGWVRVDKLDESNWLIEEIQQDLDAIQDDHWAKQAGHDTTGTWEQQHRRKGKEAEDLEARLKELDDAVEIGNQWITVVKKWRPQWDAWEAELPNPKHDPIMVLFNDYGHTIHNSNNEEIPGIEEWKTLFDKCLQAIQDTTAVGVSYIKRVLMGDPAKLKEEWLDGEIKPERYQLKNQAVEARTQQNEIKSKMDDKHPEVPGAAEWQKDIEEMKATITKFPRWAIHAVKQAAKENGVENLWWVTYNQKKALGGANPPRSFTSDQLAKKFGFRKIGMESIDLKERPSFWIIKSKIEKTATHANDLGEDKSHADVDQFLWMAPVDQVMTEQTKPLDIGVFG